MTTQVRQVLDLYDALPEAEKREVVAEVIRRMPDNDDLTADDHDALADELFTTLDAEEAARGTAR